MHLEEARGLKQELLMSFAGAARVGGRPMALETQRVDALPALHPTFALGVAPGGRAGYRVAVRVQRRELADEALATIRQRTRREVDVRYVGRIVKATAAAAGWTRTRTRPLRIGLSIGHYAITAGALGAFVRKAPVGETSDPETMYILSNNHVLADENRGHLGDAILQPGSYDGGQLEADRVARLTAFIPLRAGSANSVDCAIAEVDAGVAFDPTLLGDDARLTGVGDLLASGEDRVTKTGRTTGVTEGRVTAFELDNVVVGYDTGNLRFDNQLEIESSGPTPFSQGGDSGSLIVTSAGHLAAALLFAGSDHGGEGGMGLTYANPIGAVLSALDVSFPI